MATSEVQICNEALARVGVSKIIASLNEASNEAVVCNLFYATCRNKLLRMHHWPFATGYTTLALISEGDPDDPLMPWAKDWTYAYRYPSDAIDIRRVVTDLGIREHTMEPYQIGRDTQGKVIYCNLEDAKVEYTIAVTDPTLFDPLFAGALTSLISTEIAMPLSAISSIRSDCLQIFREELMLAKTVSANERVDVRDLPGDFLRSRS